MDSFVDITSYGDGAYKVIIVAALLIVMQILMVGGRFYSRKLRKVPLAADDYVLLTAAILTLGLCALALAFPRIAGIGAPIMISQVEELSEGKILGQSFMAWLILYGLSIALSKCAILLLYVRVFSTSNKIFILSVFLVGFLVIATGIANTFVAIFQCSPVAYEWNKSIQGGTCIDEIAFARYMTIPNVVTGAIMLIMPLPLSWRLNLTVSARIGLIATFLHGIIGFVASCARLSIFFHTDISNFNNNTSLVWTIWTINEPANYIIAACLPTLRPIFLLIFPSSFFILSNGRSSKRSTPRNKILQSPGSSMMLSPLDGPASPREARMSGRGSRGRGGVEMAMAMAEDGEEDAGGAAAARRHIFPPRRGEHARSQCDECWVDIEAAHPLRGGGRNNNHDNHRGHGHSNSSGGEGAEHRRAVMRAPGCEEGKDEVVVETMIEVSHAENYF